MGKEMLWVAGILGGMMLAADSSKSPTKAKRSNPSVSDLKKRIKHYTGQTPTLEGSTYIIDDKLPKRPAFMFEGKKHFYEQLKSHLKREGFKVSVEKIDSYMVIKFLGEITHKETPVDVYAKKALALNKKKSDYMSDYQCGILHKNYPAIFAAYVCFDDAKKSVVIFLKRGGSQAIVFDPKHPEGHETNLDYDKYVGSVGSGILRGQGMRCDLNKDRLFEKYNLKAILQIRIVEKNQGIRGDNDMMVMYIRESYSNFYILQILTRDKAIITIRWDLLAKKVKNYTMYKA